MVDPPPEHEHVEGLLALPYVTPAGVVGFKFRALDPEANPKYMGVSGQKSRLYNVMAFHQTADVIAITEGEIDALTLHHLCDIPAVCVPGAKAWNRRVHPRCFDGFSQVWIFADNDKKEDGTNPGMELAYKIRDDVPQAKIVRLEPDVDVNDMYVRNGRECLRSLIGLEG